MKLEKNKHDHKLTQWLKVGIFALLMLAPLFASLTQTLYVTLNKNAKDSWSGTQLKTEKVLLNYDTNDVNKLSDLVDNNIYLVDYNFLYGNDEVSIDILNERYTDNGYYFNISKPILTLSYDTTLIYSYPSSFLNGSDISGRFDFGGINLFFNAENNFYLFEFDNQLDEIFSIRCFTSESLSINIKFLIQFEDVYDDINGYYVVNEDLIDYLTIVPYDMLPYTYIEVNSNSTLDNAFYYGVDQMTKSDLFNWTENTALYTGIKAMTDNLQVETNAIAILLTYWMILTIIYIIIDIVTNMFTFLTHMIVRSE